MIKLLDVIWLPLRISLLMNVAMVTAQTRPSPTPTITPTIAAQGGGTTVWVRTVPTCQTNIYGCNTCIEFATNPASGAQSQKFFSCSKCDDNLFLQKFTDPTITTMTVQRNICVPSCQSNLGLHEDIKNRECVYLGPYCSDAGTTTSSLDGSEELTCSHSPYNKMGYVLGQRSQILSYLQRETYVDPLSVSNTLDGFKALSESYVPPNFEAKNLTITDAMKEQNALAVGECQRSYCRRCLASNLTYCQTCWGRFSKQDSGYSCEHEFACRGKHDHSTGCYQANYNCQTCNICSLGYTRQTDGTCQKCSDTDRNCKDCQGSARAGTLKCLWCTDGFGPDANGVCKQCTSANTKTCTFDAAGKEAIGRCDITHTLNGEGTACVEQCKTEEYPATQTGDYGISAIQCKSCDSSCRSCIGPNKDDCMSCSGGLRLEIAANSNNRGTCVAKTQSTSSTVKIFVRSNQANAADTSRLQYNGQIASDVLDGIYRAYVAGAKVYGAKIEVLLETGTHVITQRNIDLFKEREHKDLLADFYSPLFDLTIRAFECTDNSHAASSTSFQCQRSSNTAAQNEVRILNKVGSQLYFQVPQKLTFKGIIVDAIDSNMDLKTGPSTQLSQECQWINGNGLPKCPTANPFKAQYDQVCGYKDPLTSLFQFRVIHRATSSVNDIQKLVITNSTFQNFFYEFGSLVRLPQAQGQLTESDKYEAPFSLQIDTSLFRNFSNCGSIVTNDYPYLRSNNDAKYDYLKAFRSSINETIAQFYQTRYQSTVPAADQQLIVMQQNTFEDFNLLKQFGTDFKYLANKVLDEFEHHGFIVQMKNYNGKLSVTSNNFQRTRLQYSDICSVDTNGNAVITYARDDSMWTSSTTEPANVLLDSTSGTRRKLQTQSMISISGMSNSATIDQNKFKDIIMTTSAVNVATSAALTMSGNNFDNVHSYMGNAHLNLLADTTKAGKIEVSGNTFGFAWPSCIYATHLTLGKLETRSTDANQMTATYQSNTVSSNLKLNMTGFKDVLYSQMTIASPMQVISSATPTNAGFTRLQQASIAATQDSLALLTVESVDLLTVQQSVFKQSYPYIINTAQQTAGRNRAATSIGVKNIVFDGVQLNNIQTTQIVLGSPEKLHITNSVISSVVTSSWAFDIASTENVVTGSKFIDLTKQIFKGSPSEVNFQISNSNFTNCVLPFEVQGGRRSPQNAKLDFKAHNTNFTSIGESGLFETSSANVVLNNSKLVNTKWPFMLRAQGSTSVMLNESSFTQVSNELKVESSSETLVNIQKSSFTNTAAPVNISYYVGQISSSNTKATVQITSSTFSQLSSPISLEANQNSLTDTGSTFSDIANFVTVKDLGSSSTLMFQQTTFTGIKVAATATGKHAEAFFQKVKYEGSSAPFDLRANSNSFYTTDSTVSNFKGSKITLNGDGTQTVAIKETNFTDTENAVQVNTTGDVALTLQQVQLTNTVSNAVDVLNCRNISLTVDDLKLSGASSVLKVLGTSKLLATINKFVTQTEIVQPLQVGSNFAHASSLVITNSVLSSGQLVLNLQGSIRIDESQLNLVQLNSAKLSSFNDTALTVNANHSTLSLSAQSNVRVKANNTIIPKLSVTTSSRLLGAKEGVKFELIDCTVTAYEFKAKFNYLFQQRPKQFSGLTLNGNGAPDLALFQELASIGTLQPTIQLINYQGQNVTVNNAKLNTMKNIFVSLNYGHASISLRSVEASAQQESILKVVSDTQAAQKIELTDLKVTLSQFNTPVIHVQQIKYPVENSRLDMTNVVITGVTVSKTSDACSLMQIQGINDINATSVSITKSQVSTTCDMLKFANAGGSISFRTLNVQESPTFHRLLSMTDVSRALIQNTNFKHTMPHQQVVVFTLSSEARTSGLVGALEMMNVQYEPDTSSATQAPTFNGGLVEFSGGNNFTATSCTFKYGQAKYGGAIYIGGTSGVKMTIIIKSSSFNSNKAEISGGALFIEKLDNHDVNLSNLTFVQNYGMKYGDNIYVQQASRLVNVGSRRRLQVTQLIHNTGSSLKMDGIVFNTPTTHNQVYIEGVESVSMDKLRFEALTRLMSIEGAAIYLTDCLNVHIKGSTFPGQHASVRGGAIYIAQNSTVKYMGQEEFSSGQTVIESNTFTNCQAQQGGCVFLQQVRNILVNGTNSFRDSVVQRYAMTTDNGGRVFIDPNSQLTNNELKKSYQPISMASLLGRGAAIFFNCNENDIKCTLQLTQGTTMIDNRVYDASSLGYIDAEKDRSIYYTGNNPPIEPDNLKYQTQQYFPPQVNGASFILIDGANWDTFYSAYTKETGRINWDGMDRADDYIKVSSFQGMPTWKTPTDLKAAFTAATIVPLDPTPYKQSLGESTGSIKPSPLLDLSMGNGQMFSYFGIVDAQNRLQASDNVTTIKVRVESYETNNFVSSPATQPQLYTQVYNTLTMKYSYEKASEFTTTATVGIVKVPRMYIEAVPGATVTLTMVVDFARMEGSTKVASLNNAHEITESFTIKIPGCPASHVVNSSFQCQECKGPLQYKPRNLPDSGTRKTIYIETCGDCNDAKLKFTCNAEGEQITKPGYLKIGFTDSYLKCPAVNASAGQYTCASGDKCAEGYTGILCDRCKDKYYKTLDGDCQKCDLGMQSQTGAIVQLVIVWLMFYLIAGILTRAGFSAQSKANRLSALVQLIKNFVHYYLVMCLLSLVFQDRWTSKLSSSSEGDIVAGYVKAVARFPFEYPVGFTVRMVSCGALGQSSQQYFQGVQQAEFISEILGALILGFMLIHFIVQITCMRQDDSDDHGEHPDNKKSVATNQPDLDMNSRRSLTGLNNMSLHRVHNSIDVDYKTEGKQINFKSNYRQDSQRISMMNSVEQMVPSNDLRPKRTKLQKYAEIENNLMQVQRPPSGFPTLQLPHYNQSQDNTKVLSPNSQINHQNNYKGGYETPMGMPSRPVQQWTPASGVSRSPSANHYEGGDIELEGGSKNNSAVNNTGGDDSIYSGAVQNKKNKKQRQRAHLPPLPANHRELAQLNDQLAQVHISDQGFSRSDFVSAEDTDPRMAQMKKKTVHSIETDDSAEEAGARVNDDQEHAQMQRPSDKNRIVVSHMRVGEYGRNGPISLSHDLKLKKDARQKSDLAQPQHFARENSSNINVKNSRNRNMNNERRAMSGMGIQSSAMEKHSDPALVHTYDAGRDNRHQISANVNTIDATTDNSKIGVNMLPQDDRRQAERGYMNQQKSMSFSTKPQDPIQEQIVVFDRFAWCYASIILVFGTQVLFYLFRVLDCTQIKDSIVMGPFTTDQMIKKDVTIAGETYAPGWQDIYYTRRDTSTECLGFKDGGVFQSLRFWYAVIYATIIFVACPIYLIKRPIFEFSMEGVAQIVRLLTVFVALNLFNKSSVTNGILVVAFLGSHLAVYFVMLCLKHAQNEEEQEEETIDELSAREGGNISVMPRKETGFMEKCTAMNNLYAGMLVVLFLSALLGLFCVLTDPNNEEKDKMLKIVIMVINIIFLLWWFAELCRNLFKQLKYALSEETHEQNETQELSQGEVIAPKNFSTATYSQQQPQIVIPPVIQQHPQIPVEVMVPEYHSKKDAMLYENQLESDEDMQDAGEDDYGEDDEVPSDTEVIQQPNFYQNMQQQSPSQGNRSLDAPATHDSGYFNQLPEVASPGGVTDISAGISDPTQAAGPADQMNKMMGGAPNDHDLYVKSVSKPNDAFKVESAAPRNSVKVQQPSGTSTPDAMTDRSPQLQQSPNAQVNETGGFALQDTFSKQIMVKDGQMFMGNSQMDSEAKTPAGQQDIYSSDSEDHVGVPINVGNKKLANQESDAIIPPIQIQQNESSHLSSIRNAPGDLHVKDALPDIQLSSQGSKRFVEESENQKKMLETSGIGKKSNSISRRESHNVSPTVAQEKEKLNGLLNELNDHLSSKNLEHSRQEEAQEKSQRKVVTPSMQTPQQPMSLQVELNSNRMNNERIEIQPMAEMFSERPHSSVISNLSANKPTHAQSLKERTAHELAKIKAQHKAEKMQLIKTYGADVDKIESKMNRELLKKKLEQIKMLKERQKKLGK